jgi:hypothetical protein
MWEHFQQSKEHNMHESLIARDCFFYIVQSMSMDVPHNASSTFVVDLYPVNLDSDFLQKRA